MRRGGTTPLMPLTSPKRDAHARTVRGIKIQ
jgi:hypothetical protein